MQYTTTITKNDDATVTIDGTLSWEDFSLFEAKAFARLGAHLELPGFRKGHVPEEIAKKHLGDELILSDMAELAIQELYPPQRQRYRRYRTPSARYHQARARKRARFLYQNSHPSCV